MPDKARILIVEDEAIVAADLEEQLLALGYDIAAIAHTGGQCLRAAAETKPHLILMDINLVYGMDGTEVALKVHCLSDTPIVFLTSYFDQATLERAKASEPYGYLVKPFDPQALRATIEMALFKHGAEQERQKLLRETQAALARVDTLSGLLPICCGCKMIRDEAGSWSEVEAYVQKHSAATFSHGYCPECARKMIADIR